MTENSYDHLAPWYDFLAGLVFGKSLLQAKRHFLNFLPTNAKILLVGGGTGQILIEILKDHSDRRVVYIEKSSKMIALASKRLNKGMLSQVRFIEGDVSRMSEDISKTAERESYDAVITNFFLDQFRKENLIQLMERLYNCLGASGLWFFVDFQLKKEARHYWWQYPLIRSMYLFFKLTTNLEARRLPEFDVHFENLNLQIVDEKLFFRQLIVSRMYKKEEASR